MFAPQSSRPKLPARKPSAKKPRKRSSPRAATSELYKLLEAKESEAFDLREQLLELEERNRLLEAERRRQAEQLSEAWGSVQRVSRERDELRQIWNSGGTPEGWPGGNQALELAKLKRGVLLRQEIIETLQQVSRELEQQLEAAGEKTADLELENKLLLEENSQINRQLEQQTEQSDQAETALRAERTRAEQAENGLAAAMEEMRMAHHAEQRRVCEGSAEAHMARMHAENMVQAMGAQLEVYRRNYGPVHSSPTSPLSPPPMSPVGPRIEIESEMQQLDRSLAEQSDAADQLRELQSRLAANEAEVASLRAAAGEAVAAKAKASQAETELELMKKSYSELRRRHVLVNRYLQV